MVKSQEYSFSDNGASIRRQSTSLIEFYGDNTNDSLSNLYYSFDQLTDYQTQMPTNTSPTPQAGEDIKMFFGVATVPVYTDKNLQS